MSDEQITVLAVDDDPSVLEAIRLGLEGDGLRVVVASDGGEALAILERHHIDVVILDIMMPGIDGWMTLMDMRNNPALADIPVIILSAKTQDEAKILAFKQGVQQYVTKPFNVLELSARVDSLARSRQRMSALSVQSPDGDLGKLPVRKGGRTVLLAIDEIVYFSSRNKSTYAHTYENQYLVDLTLGQLEERLARASFARVHRGYLVNLSRVREIERQAGAYVVVAADRDETHIVVSRRQVRAFREAVGI